MSRSNSASRRPRPARPAPARPLSASISPERWIGMALGPIALAALVLGWFTR